MIAERVLDTDIFSELARGKNETVVRRGQAYIATGRRLTITALTVAEVIAGYQHRGHTAPMQSFLDRLESLDVLPLTGEAAIVAGRIAGHLRQAGQPIGDFDPLIAAIAICHGHTLVTGNTRHYQRIIDLRYDLQLDDWREPVST